MMRSPHLVAVFAATSLFIVGYCLFSSSGLSKLWQMKHKENELKSDIAFLKKQVLNLESEIFLLSGKTKESLEYIAYVARKEHGFIGSDEFLILDKRQNTETKQP